MRNSKLLIFPLISLSLLLISFVLLSFWGYQIFYKSKNEKKKAVAMKDSVSLINGTRDSLQKMYSATLSTLDNHLDIPVNKSDSLNANPDVKPEEFYKLRNEISGLLTNPATNGDLEIARQKISELQQSIQELHNRNSSVEEENKKLNAVLKQLINRKVREQNGKTTVAENKVVTVKTNNAPAIIVNDLHLSAIKINENKKEVETTLAEQTEKFAGYFTIRNNNNYNNTEIFIVVTQPDGHVMQNSQWDAGSFETAAGRKIYSYKINFDGNRNEATRLQFPISGDNFKKGNYTVQIYYNGGVVGKIIKTLF